MSSWSAAAIVAAAPLLALFLALAFAGARIVACINRLPLGARIALPGAGAFSYYLATHSSPYFQSSFVILYALLPVLLVALLWRASQQDPLQEGNWRDLVVLAVLGLVVEFKFFEQAWPPQLRSLNRLLLLDTGLYGFLVVRQLTNVGFDFRPRLDDFRTGLRELLFYAPLAIPLGLGLGFLHFHAVLPGLRAFLISWISIFAFVAVLEETYFRGWIQNLLERRIGRRWSLIVTAILFGLSHFNKGATHFNWRYVLLATFAGVFYGRAWRQNRRLMASAITHASVDTIWSMWLR